MCFKLCAITALGGATRPLKNFNLQLIITGVPLHPVHTKLGMDVIWIRFTLHDKFTPLNVLRLTFGACHSTFLCRHRCLRLYLLFLPIIIYWDS